MTTPFEAFVNGELPKRILTEASPTSWTPGLLLTTTGVALGVEASEVTSLGLEPNIYGSGVATEFWNGEKNFVAITASDVGAIPVSDRGALSGVASLDETGKIPLSQIPAAAIERVVVVADETARFLLNTGDVQNGDVVDQQSPKVIYFVVDDANLDNSSGYSELVAGTAASVAWSGVTGIPVIISDISSISGSVDGDVLQKVGGVWVNRTMAQLKTSLAIATSDVSGLDTALGLKAPSANPTLTGTVTIPTVTAGDSSTAAASTAFVAGELSTYAQPKDSTLTALAAYNSNGFVVQTAADTFTSRSLATGQGITILNHSAVSANPTISITDTAVTPGTYGSVAKIPRIVVDSMGRITDASELDNGVFSDSVFRIQDNLAPTKQTAFELSGITAGQTRTITMPDADINLGDIANKQPLDATLTALASYNTNGVLVQTAADTFVGRTITGSTNISVLDGGGVAGNPTLSIPASGVTAGAYGSTTQVPVITTLVDGRISSVTLATIAAPTLTEANFSVAKTGAPTFTVSWSLTALTAARVWTVPDVALNLGKIPTGISYDATTGFVTLTNSDASTFVTSNTGAIADNVLRIQSSSDATRKIGFSATGIAAGNTRTITMPNANVALGKVPTGLSYANGVITMPTSDSSSFTATISLLAVTQVTTNITLAVNTSYAVKAFNSLTLTLPAAGMVDGDTIRINSMNDSSTPNGFGGATVVASASTRYIRLRGATTTSTSLTLPESYAGALGVTGGIESSYVFTWNATDGAWYYHRIQEGRAMDASEFQIYKNSSFGRAVFNVDAISSLAQRTITVPDTDVNLGKLTNSAVAPSAWSVPASGTAFQASTTLDYSVFIVGGTVSLVEWSRNGTTWFNVGVVAGEVQLSAGDRIRLTYTVAPTGTLVPR